MSAERRSRPKDAQAERTRWELWAIIAIVVVGTLGSIVWRAVSHHPASRQTEWAPTSAPAAASLPAAPGGMPAHPGP